MNTDELRFQMTSGENAGAWTIDQKPLVLRLSKHEHQPEGGGYDQEEFVGVCRARPDAVCRLRGSGHSTAGDDLD